MNKKYDVIVIGGGPAGSVSSALLAMEGFNILLLEKEQFPRYTVGESIIPHFWKFTDAIGASEQIEQEGFIKKAGGFVQWNGTLRTVSFKDFGFTRPALHVERATFDNILLSRSKKLGTTVIEQAVVKEVVFKDELAIVTYKDIQKQDELKVEAKFVIDASGPGAVIGKQYDLVKIDKNFRFQAFWGYFESTSYINSKGEVTDFKHRYNDPPMTLISDTGDWGWVWQMVLQNQVSIGALVPRSKLKTFKQGGSNVQNRFKNYLANVPLISKLIDGKSMKDTIRTVRDYAYITDKPYYKNSYLIGDATAFFDPINSEGITMAMYGATIAAWAIKNSLKKPSRKEFYQKAYAFTLQKRLNLFHFLAFPDELIPEHLSQSLKDSILNQSNSENYLTLAQLSITNRGKDFHKILEELGLENKNFFKEVEIPEGLI